jgi:ABC-type polar amino acid transport system ATPase subunit
VKAAARAVRSDIGMVFQHFNLWPHMTVLENLIEAPIRAKKLPKDQAIAIAEKLLAKVDLSDKRDAYPARLSGGQQQRVAIARALAHVAQGAAVRRGDQRARSRIAPRGAAGDARSWPWRHDHAGGHHEMNFARHVGTRTVFMDRGEVVEEAPGAAFFAAPKTERARRFLQQFED